MTLSTVTGGTSSAAQSCGSLTRAFSNSRIDVKLADCCTSGFGRRRLCTDQRFLRFPTRRWNSFCLS